MQERAQWDWAVFPGNWGTPLKNQEVTFYCLGNNRKLACLQGSALCSALCPVLGSASTACSTLCRMVLLMQSWTLLLSWAASAAPPPRLCCARAAETTLDQCPDTEATRSLRTAFSLLNVVTSVTGGGKAGAPA